MPLASFAIHPRQEKCFPFDYSLLHIWSPLPHLQSNTSISWSYLYPLHTSFVCSSPLSKSSLGFGLSWTSQSDKTITNQCPGHSTPRPKNGLSFQYLLALVCAFQASLWKLDPQWEVEAGSEAPASAFHALPWLWSITFHLRNFLHYLK